MNRREPSVVVVTATVGGEALRRCVNSVRSQRYPAVRQLVVVDGAQHATGVETALADADGVDVLVLPRNTGHSGHFGYRIYGAVPLLVDDDVVMYLDEDNWIDPDHVASVVATLTSTGAAWAYALRRIRAGDGSVICEDDCDSLGHWPKFAARLEADEVAPDERAMHRAYPHLVDANCYALPRPLACEVAPLWQNRHADSVVGTFLVRSRTGACTGRSTVNYVLGGDSGTPPEWFTDGNHQTSRIYRDMDRLPWRAAPAALGPGGADHPRPR